MTTKILTKQNQKIPPLLNNNTQFTTTNIDKAELFANTQQDQFTLNTNLLDYNYDNYINNSVNNFLHTPTPSPI